MKKLIVGVLLCLSVSLNAENPRGIRNNNPGNIRGTHFSYALWPGAVGIDEEEYLKFRRPIDGIRAIVINLRTYHQKYLVCTINAVVCRWTYGEANKQERLNYITVLSERVGAKPLEFINMEDARVLEKLTRAIIYYENGVDPYHETVYSRIFPRGPLK